MELLNVLMTVSSRWCKFSIFQISDSFDCSSSDQSIFTSLWDDSFLSEERSKRESEDPILMMSELSSGDLDKDDEVSIAVGKV